MLVVLLGLFAASLNSGEAAPRLNIRAYNATGKVDNFANNKDAKVLLSLGTRVLLICDVEGLSERNNVVSYRWFHNCTGDTNGQCQIQDGNPYYRLVKENLLVDVTSWDQGGRYSCFVKFSNSSVSSQITPSITVIGNPVPFLYTPISLLPEHSVLTDVQQVTGRNGQQWITCRIGERGTRPQIWTGSNEVASSNSTVTSATIGLGTQRSNGLYHCSSGNSGRKYFSLFLRNLVTLPTPTVSARDSSIWALTSPDGSQVERYIVEFECRVQNMAFVEKFVSVSASGGTGRVAISVSCFGGLGQLYRVKVWAVSGPNISPALVCTTNGQCREEGGRGTPSTTPITGTPTTLPNTLSRATPTTPTTPTTETTPPAGDTNKSSPTSRSHGPSTDHVKMKSDDTCARIPSTVVPISVGALMALVAIGTFTAGVVMLVRAKRVLHHFSQTPPPGTDNYEMVDERERRAPLCARVYEDVDKQYTETDGCTEYSTYYQELNLAKMERREYASIKA